MDNKEDILLSVKDLHIQYTKRKAVVKAVNGVTFDVCRGETLGLVGETGAGKTTTALAIMQLIQSPPGSYAGGEIVFDGHDVLAMSKKQLRTYRGRDVSMIFQDPMTSLNPVLTVGDQISEVIRIHEKISLTEANKKALHMLETVGISADRFSDYPHQFSGGMKQRIVIAIALACNPKLLIADEPTTALDVTIQAQVLEMMNNLKHEFNTSMILITHDLGIVAEVCDKVAIIYAGEIVEYGSVEDVFNHRSHPYTIGLFDSIPDFDTEVDRLRPIPGLMPDPVNLPSGCAFSPRCPNAMQCCHEKKPAMTQLSDGHQVRCFKFSEEASE